MNNNKMINCVIVDDELSSQKVLEHFISDTEILNLKTTCFNGEEAFKYLQLNQDVDLLFLDINMPKQTGLEFYKSLKNPPPVIFTTAYPQYAVDGFEVNATDYLLKPISYPRFLTAINKVLQNKNLENSEDRFILLKENKTLHKIFYDDIQYLEAFGDYVKVYIEDKVIVTHSTFNKLINSLPEFFLRIHKSYSINLNRMNHLSGNTITVDSHSLPIGKTYKEKVLSALKL